MENRCHGLKKGGDGFRAHTLKRRGGKGVRLDGKRERDKATSHGRHGQNRRRRSNRARGGRTREKEKDGRFSRAFFLASGNGFG